MNDGFTDLRLNSQEGQIQESFWPSFTDIMTTVVMIFLIAMVVLLVRNMHLVQQLRTSMEAEQVAAELARATGKEKDSLSIALDKAETRLQQLRLTIQQLQEKGVQREKLITGQLSQIATLTGERDDLSQRSAQLALQRDQVKADLENTQAELLTANTSLQNRRVELAAARSESASLQANVATLQKNLGAAQDTASELQDQLAARTTELSSSRQAAQAMQLKYQSLSGDFATLKVKYNKLIRPARSPIGRYVVEVRYWKTPDGKFHITWRQNEQGDYQPITHKQLDQALTRLEKQHNNGLFVRIIFPNSAGLSYNEAWTFTNDLHSKFDYYFRNDADPSDTAQ